jgi:hypothetical protein
MQIIVDLVRIASVMHFRGQIVADFHIAEFIDFSQAGQAESLDSCT